ncbi:hypothetical protein CWI36_1519p0010 [Hamiltosporidium magnivora]|uniref:Uncharacterized protein n=1 Tax=Hamiltosporidium magnivora TaxID=148818 RepID=A0A4Q9L2V5_9MICR|nr:hypothetical protein CWI36_1519p0010 [Hamiltosporidium magnivora]
MERCKPKFLPFHLGPVSYKNGTFTFQRPDKLSPIPSFFPTVVKNATSIKFFGRMKTFEIISASSIIYSINNKEFHVRDIDSNKSYSFKVNEEVKSLIVTPSVIYLIAKNYLYTANQKVLKCIQMSNIIDFDFSEITNELFILTDTCISIYGEVRQRSTYAHYLPKPLFIRVLQHPRLVVVSLIRHLILVDLRSSTIKQNPLFKLRNLDSSIKENIELRNPKKGAKSKEKKKLEKKKSNVNKESEETKESIESNENKISKVSNENKISKVSNANEECEETKESIESNENKISKVFNVNKESKMSYENKINKENTENRLNKKNKGNKANISNDLRKDTVKKNKLKKSDVDKTKKLKLMIPEYKYTKISKKKGFERPNYDFDKKNPIYSNLTVLMVFNEDITKINKYENGLYIFCFMRIYRIPDIRTGITFCDEIGVFLRNCKMYIGERDLIFYNKRGVFQYTSRNNLFDTRVCSYDIDGFAAFSLKNNIYGFLFEDKCIMFEEKNINDYNKYQIPLKYGHDYISDFFKKPRFGLDFIGLTRNYKTIYEDELSCELLDEIEGMIKEIKGTKKEEGVKTQEQPLLDIFYDAQSDTCGF